MIPQSKQRLRSASQFYPIANKENSDSKGVARYTVDFGQVLTSPNSKAPLNFICEFFKDEITHQKLISSH